MPRDKGEDADGDWLVEEAHEWGVDTPIISSQQDESRDKSTSLEKGPSDTTIPKAALRAMEDRRHSTVHPERQLRRLLGSGDSMLYVIDDGLEHFMIARVVGKDADGAVYCLVARISHGRFQELESGTASLESSFAEARDIELTSVFDSGSASNVVNVEHYRRAEDVPAEYLPPSPFQQFT
jgi:hypothetical protein